MDIKVTNSLLKRLKAFFILNVYKILKNLKTCILNLLDLTKPYNLQVFHSKIKT